MNECVQIAFINLLLPMNIRKQKKRKIHLTTDKNQQQMAADKLFQISHYQQINSFDEPQVFMRDSVSYTTPNYIKLKKYSQTSENKNNSLATFDLCLLTKHDTMPFSKLKKKKTILNELQSTYVFVGRKIHEKQSKPQRRSISLDEKLNSSSKGHAQQYRSNTIQSCKATFINKANKYSPLRLKNLNLKQSQSFYQNRKCSFPQMFSPVKGKSLNQIVQKLSLFSKTIQNI